MEFLAFRAAAFIAAPAGFAWAGSFRALGQSRKPVHGLLRGIVLTTMAGVLAQLERACPARLD